MGLSSRYIFGEPQLDRLDEMLLDLEFIGDSPAAAKLAAGLSEFEIYIRNNRDFYPELWGALSRNWTMCSGVDIAISQGTQGRSLTPDL